ncbi:MAG: hypothetical protein JRJ60_21330 [Deltaproteobacteria bacterium]|nr:hypothetical protein [Deltaproteobacteria bacterium]
MDNMAESGIKKTMVVLLGLVLGLFFSTQSVAQSRHAVSFKTPAKDATYTQQYSIDVGDVPGHKVRIYEVHRTYAHNPPAFEGIRLKEVWRRGYSDYMDVNGRAWGYDTYVLESGEKIFLRWSGTSAAFEGAGEKGKSRFIGILTITGGTGGFLGIRGTLKETVVFSPGSGLNEAHTQGEYWIEK